MKCIFLRTLNIKVVFLQVNLGEQFKKPCSRNGPLMAPPSLKYCGSLVFIVWVQVRVAVAKSKVQAQFKLSPRGLGAELKQQ